MVGTGKQKAEYGDFQTPMVLAQAVCARLAHRALQPATLLEPTCGIGNFLLAGLDQFQTVGAAIGVEINPAHVQRASQALHQRQDAHKTRLMQADFFATDWKRLIGDLAEPILVLGNPPWVTNSELGTLGSRNLPVKSNFQKHDGLDALTGKANFDISEWMLIRLVEALNHRRATLAMLCKAATARKVLCYAWRNGMAVERSVIYGIDAERHFDAAVDAVFLIADFRPGAADRQARVYRDLTEANEPKIIGYEDGILLADISAYHRWRHLCGTETFQWRSGIKHDCAKVMELRREGGKYRNGLGQIVELENTFVYPMLKSSGLGKAQQGPSNRVMLVPQRRVSEDTAHIEHEAPKTWRYLQSHADRLCGRASSIYRDRPCFAIFGVGDYSFAPWKVAISGFYKRLIFAPVGPVEGRPVVFDDTSYFVPCETC